MVLLMIPKSCLSVLKCVFNDSEMLFNAFEMILKCFVYDFEKLFNDFEMFF